MLYRITNGSITLNGNTILEEINFDIKNKDKVGIVGKNGCGKTTLLKSIVDNELLTEGIGNNKFNISKTSGMKIGYLKQVAFSNEDILMYDEIYNSHEEIKHLEDALEDYINNKDLSDESVLSKYLNLQDRYEYLGGYTYKKEIEILIKKFGFSEVDKTKKLSEFSGGQKTKINFIKLLLSKPDLLLLDEPTNHLDISSIEWLEGYLKNYPRAVVVVSHDRMFINNIVDYIYEIEYGTMEKYMGNYDYYEVEKKTRYERRLRDYEYQQNEIKRLKAIYERFRYKPSKASMAMSKLKQIERMTLIDSPNKDSKRSFRFKLDNVDESGRVVLKLKRLSFGYDHSFGIVDLEVNRGNRLAIIGDNGCGKSTLIKTIANKMEKLSGKCEYGINVKMGYFDQELAFTDNDLTIYQEMRERYKNLTDLEIRNLLGSFMFTEDDIYKKIDNLSGGEKVRLKLCEIMYDMPNLLLLDEPTNHMDINARIALENILSKYNGTIIFVSHDRYFIKKIATSILDFTNKEIKYYPYMYLYYERDIEKDINEDIIKNEDRVNRLDKAKRKENKGSNKNNSYKDKLMKDIINLETKINELNNNLLEERIYTDYQESLRIKKEIDKLEIKLNDLYGLFDNL